MVEITGTVGNGGANRADDVALMQLLLRVTKNAKGQSYFTGDYTGTATGALADAIKALQLEQKLIGDPAAKPPVPQPAGSTEKAGLLGPNTKTLTALLAKIPVDFKEARVLPGAATIYLAGQAGKAAASAATIRAADLNSAFRTKVAQLVDTFYKDRKIVLEIPPDGWRRTFAEQANVNPAATGAGPGESPHQYGRAVDIGFQGLQWVTPGGVIKVVDYWLNGQGMPLPTQGQFWAARNAVAFNSLGLFKTNKPGDLIHVQGFDDANVGWGASLAALVQKVSPTKALWSVVTGAPNKYKVDLKLGAALTVGSANQIWAGVATIDKSELVKALNAKRGADPTFSVEKFFGLSPKPAPPSAPGPAAPKKAVPLTEADIKPEYVKYLQTLLQTEFKAADKGWDQWVPVK